MLLTILSLVIGIICLVLGIILCNKTCSEGWMGLAVFGGFLTLFGCISSIIILDNRCAKKVELEEYQNLKEQVDYVRYDDTFTSENLRNQVLEMNNKISRNKVYGKSIWVSGFYNPELGECEKLKWRGE